MLEDLIAALPEQRRPPLQAELRRLQRSSERAFSDPEDRARAEQGDSQGLGGHAAHVEAGLELGRVVENPVTQVLLPVAIVAITFALGTTLTFDDMRRVLQRPRAFLLGILLHTLLLPAIAFAVAVALSLPPPIATGLVLIASCPANVSANILTHLARGDTMLSTCLTAAASLASVVTLPLFVNAALSFFAAGATAVRLPVLTSSLGLFFLSTLPVLAGMRLRQVRPQAARAVETRLGGLGLAVIVLVIAAAVWSMKDDVLPALLSAGGPALLTSVLSMSCAWGASLSSACRASSASPSASNAACKTSPSPPSSP